MQLSLDNSQCCYWSALESNIMSPEVVRTDIGKHHLFVGPTGAGKSRLVRGLAIALTGATEDVAGKSTPVRATATLAELSHPSAQGFVTTAYLTTGETSSYELKISPKGVVSKIPSLLEEHPWTLPVRKITEMLTGSPAIVRANFLPYILGDLDDPHIVSRRLPEDIKSACASRDVSVPSSLDGLSTAIESARKRKIALDRAVRHNESLIRTLEEGLPPEPTESELAGADALLAAAKAAQAAPDYSALREELELLQKRLKKAQKRVSKLPKIPEEPEEPDLLVPDAVPSKFADRHDILTAAIRVLELQVTEDRQRCICCGDEHRVKEYAARIPEVEKLLAKLSKKMEKAIRKEAKSVAARNEVLLCEYRAACAAHRASSQLVRESKSKVRSWQTRYDSISETLKNPVPASPATVDGAREVRARLYKAASSYDTLRGARSEIFKDKQSATFWGSYYSLLSQISLEIMKEVLATFTDRCQVYMPEGWSFSLDLVRKGKECFLPTLHREDRDSCASLSGGERLILLICMAAACLETLDKPPRAPIFMPAEERGLYGKSLADFCKATKDFPYQVLLYSMARPKGMPRAGWTVSS